MSSIIQRAPIVAGGFALWSTVFSSIDCSLVYVRKKEDPWNSIISGAATGGILTVKRGIPTMVGSVIVGGVIFAVLEGIGIIMTTCQASQFDTPPKDQPPPVNENDQ